MTENEAIERIKKDACNNRCIPQLCNDGCMYGDTKCAFSVAIKALDEVQQYRAIGTVEELKAAMKYVHLAKKYGTVGQVIENCVKYEKIGTPKECRAALKKQTAKKPKEYEDKYYVCPTCGNVLLHKWMKYPDKLMDKSNGMLYCLGCGQKLDWEDEE